MRGFTWMKIMGLASITTLGLAACSREGPHQGVVDVTSSLQDMHKGALAIQDGLDAWGQGKTLDGVEAMGRGVATVKGGMGRMGTGLGMLHDTGLGDTCTTLIDAGYKGMASSVRSLEEGHALLTDGSPWNDDKGLAMVKMGLSGLNAEFATLDNGAKGLGVDTRYTRQAPASERMMVASNSGLTSDPCAPRK